MWEFIWSPPPLLSNQMKSVHNVNCLFSYLLMDWDDDDDDDDDDGGGGDEEEEGEEGEGGGICPVQGLLL